MPTLAPMIASTSAQREAENNWSKNRSALLSTQPMAVESLDQTVLDVEWVYARDGSLTGMTPEQQWWGGCSVPLLAAAAVLESLEAASVGSCQLDPTSAGLVRAARRRMGVWPVLFALQPDPKIARMILSCHDFSEQISRHRLWMVTGNDWSQQLRQLFEAQPGLATPTRFIRTKWSTDELINPMISAAQEIFSAVLGDRAADLAIRQENPTYSTDRRKILIVGGREFRLWDNAAETLDQKLSQIEQSDGLKIQRFDTDDALSGSPLALLRAASTSGSVVSANLCRADCNQLLPLQLPWVTWVTLPAVPAFGNAGPMDSLVLADPGWQPLARKAGWPDDRIRLCGWPTQRAKTEASVTNPRLGFICDTRTIEIPASVKNYSSHKLLWELIEEELLADPLAVEKVDEYLSDRAGQLNIAVEALDRRSFIESLIVPSYQQGLAQLLLAQKLPVGLYGKGWSELDGFAGSAIGNQPLENQPLENQTELDAAIAGCTALVYCWPERFAHPIESVGKPVVYRSGRDRSQLIRSARQAIHESKPSTNRKNELAAIIVQSILLV